MHEHKWKTVHPKGTHRVVVTKELPGTHWLRILEKADCRVEICTSEQILNTGDIREAIGDHCQGAIGQLTERWDGELFETLKKAGGVVYSNYAVGFNNVELAAATRFGIPVGNTPGVLTETTAEMAVALTFAAARRLGEAERYLRAGRFTGWLPNLFVGELLTGKTVGIIGAGRIGSAYAGMMAMGHRMNVLYYDRVPNTELEDTIDAFSGFLVGNGQPPLTCRRVENLDELLRLADCVSIHTVLDKSTHHLIDAQKLALMKENAILVNTSRGPVIDEAALVAHAGTHPQFKAGLDVFENEPELSEGLKELDNVVIVPHIASATNWTRSGMATLAACNVAGIILGYPAWNRPEVLNFLEQETPKAAPSILNADALQIPLA